MYDNSGRQFYLLNVVFLLLPQHFSQISSLFPKVFIGKNVTSFKFMNVSQDHTFIFAVGTFYHDCYWVFFSCFILFLVVFPFILRVRSMMMPSRNSNFSRKIFLTFVSHIVHVFYPSLR